MKKLCILLIVCLLASCKTVSQKKIETVNKDITSIETNIKTIKESIKESNEIIKEVKKLCPVEEIEILQEQVNIITNLLDTTEYQLYYLKNNVEDIKLLTKQDINILKNRLLKTRLFLLILICIAIFSIKKRNEL